MAPKLSTRERVWIAAFILVMVLGFLTGVYVLVTEYLS